MSCDDVRAMLIDSLVARRPPTEPALLAHLESCAACRAEWAAYETLWKELGDLDPIEPAPEAAARFARRLAVASTDAPRAPRGLSRFAGAIAATMVLVALLAGYWAGGRHSGAQLAAHGADTTDTEPAFLLLLHIDSTFRGATTPTQDTSMLHEYERWADGLAPTAKVIDGERLVRDTARWLGPSRRATPALGDQVDGFILIRAKDLATAREVAATCPHLKYGGRIELREINRS